MSSWAAEVRRILCPVAAHKQFSGGTAAYLDGAICGGLHVLSAGLQSGGGSGPSMTRFGIAVDDAASRIAVISKRPMFFFTAQLLVRIPHRDKVP